MVNECRKRRKANSFLRKVIFPYRISNASQLVFLLQWMLLVVVVGMALRKLIRRVGKKYSLLFITEWFNFFLSSKNKTSLFFFVHVSVSDIAFASVSVLTVWIYIHSKLAGLFFRKLEVSVSFFSFFIWKNMNTLLKIAKSCKGKYFFLLVVCVSIAYPFFLKWYHPNNLFNFFSCLQTFWCECVHCETSAMH